MSGVLSLKAIGGGPFPPVIPWDLPLNLLMGTTVAAVKNMNIHTDEDPARL